MSVLIKGLEMPKNCYECPSWWNGCNHQHDIFGYTEERPSDCPLVPVPPHGRLIDVDALPFEECEYADGSPVFLIEKQAVDNAPTIIEAEVDDDSK